MLSVCALCVLQLVFGEEAFRASCLLVIIKRPFKVPW